MFANRLRGVRKRFPGDVWVALASLAILALAGSAWYQRLEKRDALLEAELGRLDREWAAVSSNLEDGRRLQLHNTAFLKKTTQLVDERNGDNWTPALRSIGVSAGPDIDLRVIHLWKNPDDPSGRLLRPLWENTRSGNSPVVAGGLVYVFDPGDGGIAVYRPSSGRALAVLPTAAGHWNSPIVVDGHIIEPTGDANDHATTGTVVIYSVR